MDMFRGTWWYVDPRISHAAFSSGHSLIFFACFLGCPSVLHLPQLLEWIVFHAASVRFLLDRGCSHCTRYVTDTSFSCRCGNYFVTRYKLKEQYQQSDDSTKKTVRQIAAKEDLKENVLEDDIDEHPVESVVPGMSRSVKMQRKGKELFWNIVRGGS